ncbi:MAG: hypothetical protein H0V70_13845 [Ktedonobacteraceae bacterium]|nr:hypothetical protein [Ktedonobacteraceae bacterium]
MSTQNAFVSGCPKKVIPGSKSGQERMVISRVHLLTGQTVTSRADGWFPCGNTTREKVVTVISDTTM